MVCISYQKCMPHCIFLTFRLLNVNNHLVKGTEWQRICPREKCRSKRSHTTFDIHICSLPLMARSQGRSVEINNYVFFKVQYPKGGKFLHVFIGEGYINRSWLEWEKEKDKGVNYEKMINWQIFYGLCEVLHRR